MGFGSAIGAPSPQTRKRTFLDCDCLKAFYARTSPSEGSMYSLPYQAPEAQIADPTHESIELSLYPQPNLSARHTDTIGNWYR